MTTFYIARHGETEWNAQNLMQGQKDSLLTPKGIEQAKNLADKLKQIKFDQIFSSDLARAKKTAEIVALEHKLIVSTSKLLRESSFGKFEGMKISGFNQLIKKQLEEMKTLTTKDRLKYRMEKSMETDEEAVSRLLTFLREISLAYSNKKILLVSHGKIMRTLLIHLGIGDYESLPRGSIKNTAYIVLESDGIEFFVKQLHGIEITSVVNKPKI